MRHKILSVLLLLMVTCLPTQTFAHTHHHEEPLPAKKNYITGEKSKLQKLIDATEPGGTLQLEGKTYRGSILINKPITIKGAAGTKINSLETTFTIMDTNNVVLEGLSLQGENVAVVASNVNTLTFKNIEVEESMTGIQITDSKDVTFENLTITGSKGHFSKKGHAIAIYNSKNVYAYNCDISSVMDGFYVEKVNNISLINNHVVNGRYAVHMMYSDNVSLKQNKLTNNMTGFMIMVANNVAVSNNIIEKNNSLNSLGVYTYDVDKLNFNNNELTENTVAMDIQNTRNMVIHNNLFSTNGTVIQVKRSGTLTIQDNEFYGNILSIRTDKDGASLQHNFYDDYTGKDYDGDGIGDTNYIATNSFGQWMVRKPVYQYFIESPSVVTLNMMDTEVTDGNELIIVDEEPVVIEKTYYAGFSINWWQLFGSGIVLIAMFIVRRKLI